MYSIEQIKYYLEAVRCGSLNRAAEKLFISQSSLSKQIRQLEKNIGCDLLLRNYEGIEPTASGRFFYEEMMHLTEKMDQVIQRTCEMTEKKKIHIGGLPNLITYVLPMYLTEIEQGEQCNVETGVCLSNEGLIAGVKNGIYDLVLASNIQENTDLCVISAFREPLYAVFSREHQILAAEQADFKDLITTEKLILYKEPCTIRRSIMKKCNELQIKPNISMELDLTESILLYIMRGDGISLLPASVAMNLDSPLVEIREISQNTIEREVSAVMLKEKENSYKKYFIKKRRKSGV